MLHLDGTERWVGHVCQSIFDDAGKFIGTRGSNRDITHRKQAEIELHQSEAMLSNAQRIAHLGSWEWDIQTNELHWSDEIYRVFGLSPQEFGATYETFLESVHPEDRNCVEQSVDAALNQKEPYSIDHRICLPDGSERMVHEEAEVKFDGDSRPICMFGTVQDITKQRQMEDALRESEGRFHLALKNSPVIVFSQDLELRYTWVHNPHPDFDPQTTIGKTDADLLSAEDAARLTAVKRRVLETGTATRAETHLTVGEQTFHYMLDVEPLHDKSGNLTGVTCVSVDISERKQAEVLLVEKEERYRSLINAIGTSEIGILLIGPDKRVRFMNEPLIAAFGDQTGELCFESVGKTSAHCHYCKIDEVIEHQATVRYQPTHANGRTYDIVAVPFRDTDEVLCKLEIIQDITERRQRQYQMEVIVSVSTALRLAKTRAEILPVVLNQLSEILQADGAAIGLHDSATGETVIELATGSAAAYSGIRIPPGKSVTGHVIATGKVYAITDARKDPQIFRPDMLGMMRSAICVPLIVQEQTIGAISMARDEKNTQLPLQFTDAEIQLATAIAELTANAIHRSTLFEQTEQRLHRLSALRTIDQTINASLDLELTLRALLEQVANQLFVDAANVLIYNPNT